MTTFILTTGTDNFTGTAGQDNTFNFTPSTLQGADIVTGVAGGAFIDILQLTAGGTVGSRAIRRRDERGAVLVLEAAGNVTL